MKEVKRNNRGSALPDLTWLGKVHLDKEEGSNHTTIFFGGSAFFFFEERKKISSLAHTPSLVFSPKEGACRL
jgi:hypothetical protein